MGFLGEMLHHTLQRTNTENLQQIIPEKELRRHSVYVRFIYYHRRSAYSAAGNMWTDPGNK